MSNAVTETGIELYSNKVIEGLTRGLAPLRAMSLNLTDELKAPGASIDVPLVSADAAADWNVSSNNFSRTAMTPKSVTLTKSTPVIAGFSVTAEQYAVLRPSWWEGKGKLNSQAVCDNILGKVAALITGANYGDTAADKAVVAQATFNQKVVARLRAAAIAKNLRLSRCTLGLSPMYFSILLGELDSNVYGGREAVVGGAIPGLLGFEAVVEIPQLSIPGFIGQSDSIAIGSAVFRPVSERPYDVVREIVEPETGLVLTLVQYPDGATGSLSETVNCQVAVGVGNETALLRLVEG
jgi:hypothetical protein